MRKIALVTAAAVALSLPLTSTATARPPEASAGSAGIGDPYFPLAGNGGYDVRDYDLDVTYQPTTDVLTGVATIRSRATQALSAFNLDFVGSTVRSVTVDGTPATWTRDGGELTVTPPRALRDRRSFTTVVRYDGVPQTIGDGQLGVSGFVHTDDGALVVGQPDVAATWFPVNDHPSDAASFTFDITVPAGLEAVANGVLKGSRTRQGSTTWTWEAKEPMAPYLATMAIGEFDLRAYRAQGIRYWDAIDPRLLTPLAPRTGTSYALTGAASSAYERLTRTIGVPQGGAQLSFWSDWDVEEGWDFLLVEARVPGTQEWTTLPVDGVTTQPLDTVCFAAGAVHPFLGHYVTPTADGCLPTGRTGAWHAVTGSSDGYQQWVVDLSGYAAAGAVEVSISYVTDDVVLRAGAVVDDIAVSTGEGSTSFEPDADPLDGWVSAGPPADSPGNEANWFVGTVADAPPTVGEIAEASFARQPEILSFLSKSFGPYPFRTAGGILDAAPIFFALETQTRPVYSPVFFTDSVSGDAVVVHELAHQWFGDSVRLERWRDIWLNEGFATYAEWLWSEAEGFATVEQINGFFTSIPADDPFWALAIGDPGPDRLFDGAVYQRGAMTLHALRLAIGDGAFFTLVQEWATSKAGETATTAEFIALAEKLSGQDLDALFDEWLYTAERPASLADAEPEPIAALSSGSARQGAGGASAAVQGARSPGRR